MKASARRWLSPLVPLYRGALGWREWRLRSGREAVRRLHFPVISVGNLSTGGSGKTPLTIALARALTERGLRIDVLSRGYGRQIGSPARVVPGGAVADFGDEPLLIARSAHVPVYVAAERYEAGILAEAEVARDWEGNDSASAHILDDGFQHRQLHRDVDIVLINRHDWHNRLLPAGNLREPREAVRRATVLAIPADEPGFEAELRAWGWEGPTWRLRRRMDVPSTEGAAVAFCGIAHPQQFFEGLEAAGQSLAARIAFPDHHPYTAQDLHLLVRTAQKAHASTLYTTEKDRVRVEPLAASFPDSLALRTVALTVEIEGATAASHWLTDRLSATPQHLAL